jgi:hypothetical protein
MKYLNMVMKESKHAPSSPFTPALANFSSS